jgi:cytochrome c peroxidase
MRSFETWVLGLLVAGHLMACGDAGSPATDGPGSDAASADAAAQDAGTDAADSAPDATSAEDGGYVWDLPSYVPKPVVPADNPMSEVKVQLGRHLFYDKRLSGNLTQSCGSCHQQKLAFTDGRAVGLGSTGQSHVRGAMSLANVAYFPSYTWANKFMDSLEKQALVPLFGTTPVELGLNGREDELIARLKADDTYQELFPEAFPGEDEPFSVGNVAKALACFERTLLSFRSPYDRYVNEGDEGAISAAAKRGGEMANGIKTQRFECSHCHGGYTFAGAVSDTGLLNTQQTFFNTGLYNIRGTGAYPENNQGLKDVTDNPADMGRFKPPSLRNIALTAPYMHDGSAVTLDDVLDHYAAGGRAITSGDYVGVGKDSPFKDGFVRGFILEGSERGDLTAFIESLTDEEFINDPRHADPWPEGSPAKGINPNQP